MRERNLIKESAYDTPRGGRGPYILVVDDEEPIRELISMVLQDEEYEVLTARDGAEALQKMRRGCPAAIVLDLMMPVMDGGRLSPSVRWFAPMCPFC